MSYSRSRQLTNPPSGEKPVIITGWPDVWHANPHVERVWRMGQMAHFYDTYYLGGDTPELVQVEPNTRSPMKALRSQDC